MYTYRIRGKRGRFKIILPLLFVPSWRYQACPVLRHHFQITNIFIRSWTGMFMRISIGNLIITGGIRLMKEYCQVLFIFFFSGRLCRNRCCTFLDFQNRFDKVCRIVFRFVRRSAVRSPASCEIGNGTYSWKFAPAIIAGLFASPQGRNTPPSVCHISSVSISVPHGFPSL